MTFIDKGKWALARWKSTGFFQHPNGTTGLGIVFEDTEIGKQIFSGLRQLFGTFDEHNELRISIIEGEILGKKPGYSVRNSSRLNSEVAVSARMGRHQSGYIHSQELSQNAGIRDTRRSISCATMLLL